MAQGHQPGISGKTLTLEKAIQTEFYHTLHDEVPGIKVHSAWAATDQADYILPEADWGIELVHDGDGLWERRSKYEVYSPLLPFTKTDVLKNWLVLDCRETYPTTACKPLLPTPPLFMELR